MARPCEYSSTTPFTAAFLALLPKREDYKSSCETFTVENQCVPRLLTEAKELQENLVDLEKADAAAKTPPKGRGKKRATVAHKRVASLGIELAIAMAAHTRLSNVSAGTKEDAGKAQTELQNLKVGFSEVTGEAKVASDSLVEV